MSGDDAGKLKGKLMLGTLWPSGQSRRSDSADWVAGVGSNPGSPEVRRSHSAPGIANRPAAVRTACETPLVKTKKKAPQEENREEDVPQEENREEEAPQEENREEEAPQEEKREEEAPQVGAKFRGLSRLVAPSQSYAPKPATALGPSASPPPSSSVPHSFT